MDDSVISAKYTHSHCLKNHYKSLIHTGCPKKFRTGIQQKISKSQKRQKKKNRESLFTF